MSRGLSSPMIAEVTAAQMRPVILVKAEFDSGDVNLWSGYGDVSYGGDTYTGAGNILSISELGETNEVEAQGAVFQLSGINSTLISLALTESYQGRPITCFLGMLDTASAIITSPVTLFKGRMDILQIDDSGSTATLSMQVENKLIDLKKSKVRRYTPEDQKQEYPADLGLDFVTALQEKEITWGVN